MYRNCFSFINKTKQTALLWHVDKEVTVVLDMYPVHVGIDGFVPVS